MTYLHSVNTLVAYKCVLLSSKILKFTFVRSKKAISRKHVDVHDVTEFLSMTSRQLSGTTETVVVAVGDNSKTVSGKSGLGHNLKAESS